MSRLGTSICYAWECNCAHVEVNWAFSPRVQRPVQTDDFSVGKRLHWSENSGAFMEGSEESCSSGHGPREAGPVCMVLYYVL